MPLEKPFDRRHRCIVFLTSLPSCRVGQLTPDVVEGTCKCVDLRGKLFARHRIGEGVQHATEPCGSASARLGLDSPTEVPLQRAALQCLDLRPRKMHCSSWSSSSIRGAGPGRLSQPPPLLWIGSGDE